MSLSRRVMVRLPEAGVIVSRDPARPYVYKVLRTYRNAKGQPTNDRRSIGRLDAASGMLIPNDYYWQVYPAGMVEVLATPDAIRSVGASFLVSQVLEQLGVVGILRDVFGADKAEAVLAVACYMARRGNVMERITDWCQTSTVRGGPLLSPQLVSRLFASITNPEKMAFFRAWTAAQGRGAFLAYDVTSVSTYAEGVGDAEWGYNRDGDKLPQINLGCYLNQASGLPVFYVTYPGSIIDKSHLTSMMAYNQDLAVSDVTFVMDRGFASTCNINYMHQHHLPYILGVESRYKAARGAVDQVRDSIHQMRHNIGAAIYASAVTGTFWGAPNTLHIYFDPQLCEQRRAELTRRIEVDTEHLSQLTQLTKQQANRYRKHFHIDLAEDGSFTFNTDQDKIEAAARDAGFFTILTSTTLSSSQILEAYRRKDTIEKAFDDLKNHVDMKRLRTHHDQTTDGKLFCAFIALIAASHIQTKVGPALKKAKRSLSKKDILTEMDKIKIVDAPTGRRLINPTTKTQNHILQALNLTQTNLQTHATKT